MKKKKKKDFLTVTFSIDWDAIWEEMDEWENDNLVDHEEYRKKLAEVIRTSLRVVKMKRKD